jgi:quercetin dioxygenase-like cupin family protein
MRLADFEELKANTVFAMGDENKMFEQYFVGKSYLNMLSNERVNIFNVTFEPGCRNNWHVHHKGGQILLCTAGRGYYQEWGKEPQELHPGDVINIPPEVKHWHGAAPGSWFAHLAIEVPAEGATNEWFEEVEAKEYDKLR